MLKLIKGLSKPKRIFFAVLITVIIAVLSLVKIKSHASGFTHIDKIKHAIAYLALSISWLFALATKIRSKFIIVLSCISYGILLEILQMTTTSYRTGEYADAIANSLGVLLGLLIYNQIFEKK